MNVPESQLSSFFQESFSGLDGSREKRKTPGTQIMPKVEGREKNSLFTT